MTDTNKLKELAERHVRQIAGFGPDGIIYTNDFKVDAKKVLKLIAEVERLRSALEAFVLRADAYLEAGRDMPDVSMEVVLEKARAAMEGGGK